MADYKIPARCLQCDGDVHQYGDVFKCAMCGMTLAEQQELAAEVAGQRRVREERDRQAAARRAETLQQQLAFVDEIREVQRVEVPPEDAEPAPAEAKTEAAAEAQGQQAAEPQPEPAAPPERPHRRRRD